jgi:signal peptidase II
LRKPLFIVFLVLFADQALKIWIKTHFEMGEEIKIADWFILHFTENPGMAFGIELGGSYGKLLLSVFRIIAVGAMFIWLRNLVKQKVHKAAITAVALILAGAAGNILDSAFYGLFFDHSIGQVASFMPEGGGYAGFLHGKVVDMLYFPLFKGFLPDWLPVWGGDYFVFFSPIFNLADFSISCGVGLLLLFQKHAFPK